MGTQFLAYGVGVVHVSRRLLGHQGRSEGPLGIQVNGIGPTCFATEFTSALVADEEFSAWAIGSGMPGILPLRPGHTQNGTSTETASLPTIGVTLDSRMMTCRRACPDPSTKPSP
ncbi:NAD(P)-dependent dehydrogenase (short-subunit alcohol dehydrogenase family) [Streptomyces sp. SAI-117]|nr:NAD(P)-dependent dehydrogenase (short-subunit alcohol dehydrogenase family) [Streptomyces sp. SAI-117]